MALIVEDGTLVANANSYCNLDYIKFYCISRGLELPANDEATEEAALLAMNYIESKAEYFDGHSASKTQSLSYPRKNAIYNGYMLDVNEIPETLKKALAHATYLVTDDVDFQPIRDGSFVSEAQVSSLKAKFNQSTIKNKDGSDYFGPVDDYLKKLYSTKYDAKLSRSHKY
jgi:hypothetical protein